MQMSEAIAITTPRIISESLKQRTAVEGFQPESIQCSPAKVETSLVIAQSPEDLECCHRIRCQVFCEEQGIFQGDDSDQRDCHAIHILARVNGEAAGVVRCFCRRPGIWVGGRLAVLKGFRGNLGAKLVREAVRTMEARSDVRRFFAIIQIQNLRFFQLLRWRPLGHQFICNGRLHQVMEYPLGLKRKGQDA